MYKNYSIKRAAILLSLYSCSTDYHSQAIRVSRYSIDGNQRISSDPYITGTLSAHNATGLLKTVTAFDPTRVCNGDIIFLNANWCAFFFEKVHPQIKAHYILVTHNSVFHAPGKYESYLNDPD